MTTATLTSKGQVTIPRNVREALKIGPGDRLEFVEVSPGRFEVIAATGDVKELRGIIQPPHTVTVEEMNAAIKARGTEK